MLEYSYGINHSYYIYTTYIRIGYEYICVIDVQNRITLHAMKRTRVICYWLLLMNIRGASAIWGSHTHFWEEISTVI